ncbi:MAG TPA: MFS transporter [Solirubrobacteraceae bacterium]|jgi:putative MFS transporter|nr:MFS transporter [Solirubrobacteraceae bacterium]
MTDLTSVEILDRSQRVATTNRTTAPATDPKQARLIAFSSGLGFLFDAYVVNIYSFVLPLLVVSFSLSSTAAGIIGSVMLAGYTLGTFAFGWAADRFGRKDTLGASILLYGITTAVSGLAGGAGLFGALRFLTGLGGAGELSVGVPYTVEAWPARRRAIGAGGVIFSMYAIGALIALGVALLVAPGAGWRLTFILAIIPALLVWGLRRALRESAPYLAARERRRREADAGQTRRQAGQIFATPALRRRLVIATLIFIANAVGYWGFLVFLQKYMLSTFGLTFRQSLALTMAFYAAMAIWPFAGAAAAERFGRRPAAVAGAVTLAITSIIAFSTHHLVVFAIAQVFGIGLLGWTWSVGQTYVAELFPTEVRGTGFGLGVAFGRIPSIAGPVLTGTLIGSIGLATIAKWFAVLWLLYIVAFLAGPETRGRSLSELDAVN